MSVALGPAIGILGSGRGSNAHAILQAIKDRKLHAQPKVVISDKEFAPILKIAQQFEVPSRWVGVDTQVPKQDRRARLARDLVACLQEHHVEFVVLAGFMRILHQDFLAAFKDQKGDCPYFKVVNIHPSLLPAFPGLNSYQQAFDYGSKQTGVTVHLVDGGLDSGPVCAQESFSIEDCKTVQEVEDRGLEIEHRLYPATLNWVLAKKFQLSWVGQESQRRQRVFPS